MEAKDKILRAKIQLQKSNPFFSYLLLHLKIIESNDLPFESMGVDNRGNLFYSPKFVDKLNDGQVEAVLSHEVLHKALLHLDRFEEKERDSLTWNIACLKGKELLLGNNKKIKDIKIGDSVIDKKGKTKVVETLKRKYNGNIYKIKASGLLPIEITDEHPLLTLSKLKSYYPISLSKNTIWKKAKDLTKNDYLIVPKIKRNLKIKNLNFNNFINNAKVNNHTQSHNIKCKNIIIDKNMAWFMGLYVAEGSLSTKNGGIKISLHKKEIDYANKVIKIMKKNNLKVSKSIKNNTLSLTISGSLIGRAFSKWFGRGAKNKKIPDFILFNKNNNIVDNFINGYIGCKNEKNITIGTTSEILAKQIQLLFFSRGIFANLSLSKRKERIIRNNILPKEKIYIISIFPNRNKKIKLNNKNINSYNRRWKEFNDYFAIPIIKINKRKYSGYVYNIETESHNYIINNAVTHNCDICVNNILVNNNFSMNIEGCILPHQNEIEVFGKKITDIQNKTAETIYDDIFSHIKKLIKDGKIKKGKGENSRTGKGQYGFDEHIYGKGDKKKGGGKDGEGEQNWKQIVTEAYTMAKNRGLTPLGVDRQIDEILETKLNWRELLYKHITNTIPHDYTYCLDKNTKIKTPKGDKELNEIKENDIIYGYKNGKIIENKVITKFTNIKKLKKYIIYTEKGSRIICSNEHKFLTDKGYTEAKDLNIGDTLNRVKSD